LIDIKTDRQDSGNRAGLSESNRIILTEAWTGGNRNEKYSFRRHNLRFCKTILQIVFAEKRFAKPFYGRFQKRSLFRKYLSNPLKKILSRKKCRKILTWLKSCIMKKIRIRGIYFIFFNFRTHYRTIFQTVLLKRTKNGLQSRFTVKRFCKSFLFQS